MVSQRQLSVTIARSILHTSLVTLLLLTNFAMSQAVRSSLRVNGQVECTVQTAKR